MKIPMSPLPRLAAATTLVTASFTVLLGSPVVGQCPSNHLLVGTIPNSGNPGTSGLFYVSLKTGKITRVTGLPTRFTLSTGYGECGAWCVVRRTTASSSVMRVSRLVR